jgi:hypothetical protein
MPNLKQSVERSARVTTAAILSNALGVFSHSSSGTTSNHPLTTVQPSPNPSHAASGFIGSGIFWFLLGAGLVGVCICCILCYRVKCQTARSEERALFSRFTTA